MNFEFNKISGLTLIELLVVITIVGVLTGLTVPVISKAVAASEQTAEVSAAKRLIEGYLTHAADNTGKLMPGYGRFDASTEDGQAIFFPASGRYPWRLAPYLGYDFEALYVNEGAQRLQSMGLDNTYGLSVSPTLGMNVRFVGGDFEHFHPQGLGAYYGPFCVTRLIQAHKPSSLIVFASARSNVGDQVVEGYYQITPPYMTKRVWSQQYNENAPASSFGFVHPRYNGKAVAAMLDGHVAMLDTTQLQDMRRWANPASQADDPEWVLTPAASGN